MLRARLLRGFRMLRRFRIVLLISFGIALVTEEVEAITWYCKDSACRNPVAEGTAGYDYNPSKLVVNHGYIPVSAGQNIIAFKQSNKPNILEVEANGKRGYIPRMLFDASKNYMEDAAPFVTMEGPIVLPEEEIVAVDSKTVDSPATNTETSTVSLVHDVETTPSALQMPPTREVVPPPPVDTTAKFNEKAVTRPSKGAMLFPSLLPEASAKEAEEQNVVADTSKDSGLKTQVTVKDTIVESTVISPPASVSSENILSSSNASRDVTGDDSQTNSTVQNTVTEKASDSASSVNVVENEAVLAVPPSEINSMPVTKNVAESGPPSKALDVELTRPSSAKENVVEDKPEPLPQKEPPLPTVPGPPSSQLAGELSASKTGTTGTSEKIEVTPQLNAVPSTTQSPPTGTNPSAVKSITESITPTDIKPPVSSPVVNKEPQIRPEARVTYQDQKGAGLGFVPYHYQNINPPPVINTKGLDRHRHNHDHSPHHGHSHQGHDHPGHDHSSPDHSHDRSHDHLHDHHEDATIATTVSPVRVTEEHKEVLAKNFSASETQTQLTFEPEASELAVEVLSDGTESNEVEVATINGTETGQLDPSTATTAPRIPMMENYDKNQITTDSEKELVIDESERYNRPRPARESLRQWPRLTHEHLDHDHDHDHSHEDHDTQHFEGSCSAKGGESCETLTQVEDHVSAHEMLSAHNTSVSSGFLHVVMEKFLHGWLDAVTEFENVSGGLRLGGMLVFAALALISMMSAAADRKVRKTMEKGFEEYDYKKETEMLALREQVKVLLKENEGSKVSSPVAPPPYVPPSVPIPMFTSTAPPTMGPCLKCGDLQMSLQNMRGTLDSNEKVLRDQRESYASILTRNNEVMTELTLVTQDRDVMKRSLEDTAQRLADSERRLYQRNAEATRNMNGPVNSQMASEAVQEVGKLRQRVLQLETENEILKRNTSQNNGVSGEDKSRMAALQAERDEAASNVRLLRQLLSEKEEEIRKMRAVEAAGGVSASRELQEKTDDLRNARKQVVRLQDELESVKRDRETQIQIRCQTFRAAADKSQRDALMARQEAWTVKQQLEDVCKRYGENMPTITNGAVTPPGMMATSPMMFSGVGFPPGPPPPSLEAFKQQVLAQQQQPRSSGHSSPRSPDLNHDRTRDRRKERKTVKKSRTLDFPANGKDGEDYDDSDAKRDRTNR